MKRAPIAALSASLILLSSCVLSTGHNSVPSSLSLAEANAIQQRLMSSYYAERGKGAPAGVTRALSPFLPSASASKATIPVNRGPILFSAAPPTYSNYPEPGQTTTFTKTLAATTATFKVYDITATTVFASGDPRRNYVEEYYVADVTDNPGWSTTTSDLTTGWALAAFNGTWDVKDPIVAPDGTSSTGWRWNQAARKQMVLSFQDGTTRTETIQSSSDPSSGGRKLATAAFDINGSLDLAQAFLPAATTDPSILYSSVVTYYVSPGPGYNYWFWAGNEAKTILGVRYYTERADTGNNTYTSYTASFEKTVSELTTSGGTYVGTVTGVFTGAKFDSLAESVLRQQVVYGLNGAQNGPTGSGLITTNMQTRVVNIAGQKDFYLTQLSSDYATLSNAANTRYTPTGTVSEVLAADPSTLAFTRNQQTSPSAGTIPYAVATVDTSGLGALATVYTSITEQTATASNPAAPVSNLLSGGTAVASFNGQQAMGNIIAPAAATVTQSMGKTGSVEAWIYISQLTDTAGIVHKGTAVDFSDECFSLQGWGAGGQMAIVLDYPGSSSYDMVASTINLNQGRWYYLVATWDTVGAKTIKLYINGVLNNSGATAGSVSSSGYKTNSSAVLVGSQLPSIYNSTWGYFGFNGRITGVNVYASVLDPTTITSRFNTYKGQTATW